MKYKYLTEEMRKELDEQVKLRGARNVIDDIVKNDWTIHINEYLESSKPKVRKDPDISYEMIKYIQNKYQKEINGGSR